MPEQLRSYGTPIGLTGERYISHRTIRFSKDSNRKGKVGIFGLSIHCEHSLPVSVGVADTTGEAGPSPTLVAAATQNSYRILGSRSVTSSQRFCEGSEAHQWNASLSQSFGAQWFHCSDLSPCNNYLSELQGNITYFLTFQLLRFPSSLVKLNDADIKYSFMGNWQWEEYSSSANFKLLLFMLLENGVPFWNN